MPRKNARRTPTALETDLRNLLEWETSVLAPQDAPALARVLVDNLPPEFAAAPAMLAILRALVDTIDVTGGTVENEDGDTAPAADPEWVDLGNLYLRAKAVIADATRVP